MTGNSLTCSGWRVCLRSSASVLGSSITAQSLGSGGCFLTGICTSHQNKEMECLLNPDTNTCNNYIYTGVALIAKFCINIAFPGAVHILATSPRHHMQNDWTPVQQVTHSILDWFANSVWSQPWLCTYPRHYKSSQWRVESGQWNKRASCRYFGVCGDTSPPNPLHHWSMCIIVISALCLWIKFA